MFQKLLIGGTCETCSEYTKSAVDGIKTFTLKTELLPVRKHNVVVSAEDGTQCKADVCGTIQKLMVDGSCEVCPEWKRQEFNGKTCASDNCLGGR